MNEQINNTSIKTSALMVKDFIKQRPRSFLLSLILLIIAGLFEGVGFVAFLPLLEIATSQTAEGNLAKTVYLVFQYFGQTPSLGALLLLIVLGICGKAILTLLAQTNIAFSIAGITEALRLNTVDSVLQADWLKFTSKKIGRVSNSIATESSITAAAYGATMNLFAMFFQILVFIIIALSTSLYVTVGGLLGGALVIVSLRKIIDFARKAGRQNVEKMNSLIEIVSDGLLLIKPLKSMGLESRLLPQLSTDIKDIKSSQRKLAVAAASLSIVQEPIVTIFLALGLYSAMMFLDYSLSELLFLLILFHRIVTRIGSLQVQYQKLSSQEAAYWSSKKLIAEFNESFDIEWGSNRDVILDNGIEFSNVSFKYPGTSLPVVSKLNFTIPSKKLVVFTGGSGSGKTTILDLLAGLIQPTEGHILINGQPLIELEKQTWKSKIGYVPQEPILFHQTIKQNITLGDSNFEELDLRFALSLAGSSDFVDKLPSGVLTNVGERGTKLSGGQRQRLSVARALIRKPSILILDEPTASLDKENERLIFKTLKELSKEMTVIVASHQEKLIELADLHINLNKGSVS